MRVEVLLAARARERLGLGARHLGRRALGAPAPVALELQNRLRRLLLLGDLEASVPTTIVETGEKKKRTVSPPSSARSRWNGCVSGSTGAASFFVARAADRWLQPTRPLVSSLNSVELTGVSMSSAQLTKLRNSS